MGVETKKDQSGTGTALQKTDFKSGNEMAALAAKQINYHLMGFYPITPSTEIAETIDSMYAEGAHDIKMIPAEGEHSAAGICYGASIAGGRVLNATSAQGLLYSLEQLPVQSGTRFPMVLNIVTRSINGPLDIRGDHSDLMFMLNTGWIILMARDPQAAYDMNIMAPKIGEHEQVRLPVAVAMDGFFTSHQKRRVEFFESDEDVRSFVGPYKEMQSAVTPEQPLTIGPYMNDPDLINSKYQLHLAMEAAREVITGVFAEFAGFSGRSYPLVDSYRMEDAESALFILNSAAETAKEAVDNFRKRGERVGIVSPNVLRPFPVAGIQENLRAATSLLIAERADSYGGNGGSLSFEVKAALHDLPENKTRCLTRIYGLGGRDFFIEDAEEMLALALEARHVVGDDGPKAFDYHGVTPGDPELDLGPYEAPITEQESARGVIEVKEDPETGRLGVKVPSVREMTRIPKRIAPGHGACPGCGIFPNLNQFFKGIEGHAVVLFQTGCGMVVTTAFPYSSHRITYIHNLFQNGSATLSGVVEMYRERQRRGEIPSDQQITFIMVSGDGGMDIGMGAALGTALRDHGMIIVEYDNEGYMNTGNQLSYSTPLGTKTTTSGTGPAEKGKSFQHKDMPQLMAATNIKYVATSVEGFARDLVQKAAKAQWYANRGHLAYVKLLSACPLSWRSKENLGTPVMRAAVDCNFFPLYEVERGFTTINYDPEAKGKKASLSDWLNMMPRSRHMTTQEYEHEYKRLEDEVERRWQRLKAMADSELL